MTQKTSPRISRNEIQKTASFHVFTGRNTRINAIYFDFKAGMTPDGKSFAGFKYMIAGDSKAINKLDLINRLKEIINDEITIGDLPGFIRFRIADTDESRFKVPLSFPSITPGPQSVMKSTDMIEMLLSAKTTEKINELLTDNVVFFKNHIDLLWLAISLKKRMIKNTLQTVL